VVVVAADPKQKEIAKSPFMASTIQPNACTRRFACSVLSMIQIQWRHAATGLGDGRGLTVDCRLQYDCRRCGRAAWPGPGGMAPSRLRQPGTCLVRLIDCQMRAWLPWFVHPIGRRL